MPHHPLWLATNVMLSSNRLLRRVLFACRSGDLSADLCRTITHLVQADSTSLLAAYRSSPVPLPGQQQQKPQTWVAVFSGSCAAGCKPAAVYYSCLVHSGHQMLCRAHCQATSVNSCIWLRQLLCWRWCNLFIAHAVVAAGEMYRLTLGDLYRLEFERSLPSQQYAPPGRSKLQQDVLRMADVECAQQLQLWTVAALCRWGSQLGSARLRWCSCMQLEVCV